MTEEKASLKQTFDVHSQDDSESEHEYTAVDLAGCSQEEYEAEVYSSLQNLSPTYNELGSASPKIRGEVSSNVQNLPLIYDELESASPTMNDERTSPVITLSAFDGRFEQIGSGNFSRVFKGRLERASRLQDVVLKVALKKLAYNVHQEVEIMKSMKSHPNIMPLVAVCSNISKGSLPVKDPDDTGMVLPYHPGGNLEDLLKNNPNTLDDEKRLSNILLGAFRGVKALHDQNIIHRDIACRNFLISNEGRVVLADFGLSRKLKNSSSAVAEDCTEDKEYYRMVSNGEVPWRLLAPESILDKIFTVSSDIWALGVMCIELALCRKQRPFHNFKTPARLQHELSKDSKLALKQLPKSCSKVLRKLVKRCCINDPSKRCPMANLIQVIEDFLKPPGPSMRMQFMKFFRGIGARQNERKDPIEFTVEVDLFEPRTTPCFGSPDSEEIRERFDEIHSLLRQAVDDGDAERLAMLENMKAEHVVFVRKLLQWYDDDGDDERADEIQQILSEVTTSETPRSTSSSSHGFSTYSFE